MSRRFPVADARGSTWTPPAWTATVLAAVVLCAGAALPACKRQEPAAPAFGITVQPPADGDEQLGPMPFTVRNGSRELRDVAILCLVDQVATTTTRLANHSELVSSPEVMAPHARQTVYCDPQVYLDPGHIRLERATIGIELAFLDAKLKDWHGVTFTFDADRTSSGRLTWNLKAVTPSPAS